MVRILYTTSLGLIYLTSGSLDLLTPSPISLNPLAAISLVYEFVFF